MSKTPSKETQQNLETLFSKHQLLPVLREQFGEIAEQYPIEEDKPMVAEMLAQIYLHRQADVITMVGILSPKYGEPQEVADKLLLFCEFDYVDFQESTGKFLVKYDVSEDVTTMLERYQYPLPMVVAPEILEDNFDTGYHTIKGLTILNGSGFFKDKDICLDHLNRANSVALTLDIDVITSEEGKLDKPVQNKGETYSDFTKRRKQIHNFYNTSVDVMESINMLSDKLYMTHKYDRRGRCYASGYHVNTQGTDYHKAVLQLANKETIKNVTR